MPVSASGASRFLRCRTSRSIWPSSLLSRPVSASVVILPAHKKCYAKKHHKEPDHEQIPGPKSEEGEGDNEIPGAEKHLQFTWQALPNNPYLPRDRDTLAAAFQKCKGRLVNPAGQDAAIVLATPEFIPLLRDEERVVQLAKIISGGFPSQKFHLTYAIVDQVAPVPGCYHPSPGISILRTRRESILPPHGELPARVMKDADALSTIEFGFGSPEGRTNIILPLARTTFTNHRTSTLVQSEINLAGETPRLIESVHVDHASFKLPTLRVPEDCHHMDAAEVEAPLLPLTRRRLVTESFGNIVKSVSLKGRSVPASEELEKAVQDLIDSGVYSPETEGPIGVWAVVTPPGCRILEPQCEPLAWTSGDGNPGEIVVHPEPENPVEQYNFDKDFDPEPLWDSLKDMEIPSFIAEEDDTPEEMNTPEKLKEEAEAIAEYVKFMQEKAVEDANDDNQYSGYTNQLRHYFGLLEGTGSRVFRVLSGGGGWGAKKGILSLDPDQSPFQLSEEADEHGFKELTAPADSLEPGQGFIPANSEIQFFKSVREGRDVHSLTYNGHIFGVTGEFSEEHARKSPLRGVQFQRFGALSNEGIYLSGALYPNARSSDGLVKLNVPHARIQLD